MKIIRFEKAVYTLPLLFGSATHTYRVDKIQKFAQSKYNLKLPIDSFYGAPTNSLWNGGRPPYYADSMIDDGTKQYYENIVLTRNIKFNIQRNSRCGGRW